MAFIFGAAFLKYEKFYATWWDVRVWVIAGLGAGVTVFLLFISGWFQNRWNTTPWLFPITATLGIIGCMFLGIYFTEPTLQENVSREYQYSNSRTGSTYYYYFGGSRYSSSSDSSNSSSSPSITIDDDAGEGIAYLFLIILVIILLFLSAFVPHFWVFACTVLLAYLAMCAIREVVREIEGERNN